MTQVAIPQHTVREWSFPNTKTGLRPSDVRAGHLWGIDLADPTTGQPYPDTAIWDHLRDSEDFVEKRLSIRWRPTVVMCEPLKETDPSSYDEIEPAYPYEPDMHDTYRWGRLKLRKAPVSEVMEVGYGFPNRQIGVSAVPASWIRIDAPFGAVKLIPDQGVAMASFNSWLLSILSNGRGIPHSIFVTYRVGKSPEWWQSNHRDLLHAVGELAAVDVLRQVATAKAAKHGGSVSISVDGMSQSRSNPASALLEQAKERHDLSVAAVDAWLQAVKGPSLEFL